MDDSWESTPHEGVWTMKTVALCRLARLWNVGHTLLEVASFCWNCRSPDWPANCTSRGVADQDGEAFAGNVSRAGAG